MLITLFLFFVKKENVSFSFEEKGENRVYKVFAVTTNFKLIKGECLMSFDVLD